MHVLLNDDIAPTGEGRVEVADDHRVVCNPPSRVLGAINKPEEVALVEIFESMDLVDDRDRAAQPLHDLSGELEAEIHLRGSDVKEQITGRGDGAVLVADDCREWMQLRWARSAEQTIPRVGSDACDTGELAVREAEADGSLQAGAIAQQLACYCLTAGVDGHNEKDRRAGQRAEHRLSERTHLGVRGPWQGFLLARFPASRAQA